MSIQHSKLLFLSALSNCCG